MEPTRVTKSLAATIDLIFTSETKNIARSGVIHVGMSDHSLIYAVRKFVIPKRRPVTKEMRKNRKLIRLTETKSMSKCGKLSQRIIVKKLKIVKTLIPKRTGN